MILREFDPWNNSLCICPKKLSLNPYTGCSHGCLYCYASSYIPRFAECRPKPRLLAALRSEVLHKKPGLLVSMSNSSDPYPPIEGDLQLTRGCIRIIKDANLRLQIVTKSDIVCRDFDLLKDMACAVSITITTLCDELSSLLEPRAPLPRRRLEAIKLLQSKGVPISARLDPIIPGINDSEIEDLVHAVCEAGALHITASTYKARPDSLKRLKAVFPMESKGLEILLKDGSQVGGARYLPEDMRARIMKQVKRAALKRGVTFSSCREGFSQELGICCDGSHLVAKNWPLEIFS
jgi:DNA repair photolyase